ncbi:hypothetical protein HDU92_001740 [Lobulomyces angularis]|nr:hypothetical protein HDU92_001740 [Lobulomyces angularis]
MILENTADSLNDLFDYYDEEIKTFIIILKHNVQSKAKKALKKKISDMGGHITTEFDIINAFVAKIPTNVVSSLSKDSSIFSMEENREISIKKEL